MIAIAAAALALCAQKDPSPPPAIPLTQQYQSKYYDIRTNATKENATELGEFMDLVFATYLQLLRPSDPKTILATRSTLVLYATEENYHASGAPPNSHAYYDRKTRNLVGWYHPVTMRSNFAHEGMHQFTDLTSKSYDVYPMWFSEGIADCFGNCEVRDAKLYMCVKTGATARHRLEIIQKALREGRQFPLDRLLFLTPMQFRTQFDLAYAQSWSFCHFLIAYPLHEDRNRQVPDGKYRRNIAVYYELLRVGDHNHSMAWEKAFPGVDLTELEKQWKHYVLAMDGGKYLGFEGADITSVEAAALKLHSGQGGVRIEKLSPGGVAEKSGLLAGDIIVEFNGRVVPRARALNHIRITLPDVPYDKPVKLTVLRQGKELELAVTWPSAQP